jgi:hypothetical protein
VSRNYFLDEKLSIERLNEIDLPPPTSSISSRPPTQETTEPEILDSRFCIKIDNRPKKSNKGRPHKEFNFDHSSLFKLLSQKYSSFELTKLA